MSSGGEVPVARRKLSRRHTEIARPVLPDEDAVVVGLFPSESAAADRSEQYLLQQRMRAIRLQRRYPNDQTPFIGVDLGTVKEKLIMWREHLPDIEPTVDCSMLAGLDPLLRLFAGAGCNFNTLSKKEMEVLVAQGVPSEKMVFSQTTKQTSHLEYAMKYKVGMLGFDSAFELHKIRSSYKEAKLLIRACVSSGGIVPKYGRSQQSCQDILNTARMLGLQVTGVIGVLKNPYDVHELKALVTVIRNLFDYSSDSLGYKASTVLVKCDIDVKDEEAFQTIAHQLNQVLLLSFLQMPGTKKGDKVRILLDPGPFFLQGAVSLAATVIGVRRSGTKDNRSVSYYVNESRKQSFNYSRLCPGLTDSPVDLFYTPKIRSNKGGVKATVHGCSDSEDDVLAVNCELPGDMSDGDMLLFPGLGPFVRASPSSYLDTPTLHYYCCTEHVMKLAAWLPGAQVPINSSLLTVPGPTPTPAREEADNDVKCIPAMAELHDSGKDTGCVGRAPQRRRR